MRVPGVAVGLAFPAKRTGASDLGNECALRASRRKPAFWNADQFPTTDFNINGENTRPRSRLARGDLQESWLPRSMSCPRRMPPGVWKPTETLLFSNVSTEVGCSSDASAAAPRPKGRPAEQLGTAAVPTQAGQQRFAKLKTKVILRSQTTCPHPYGSRSPVV